MKETTIIIRLEKELKEKLMVLAQKNDRVLSDFIRIQLKKLVEHKVKK